MASKSYYFIRTLITLRKKINAVFVSNYSKKNNNYANFPVIMFITKIVQIVGYV